MAAIPPEALEALRAKVDIVDLVGRYVSLRRAGRNYKGLCPFHDEKTPSFNVNPAFKGFKCFGCGEGGDAIAFVMKIEGKSFVEAVRKLAALYGVPLPAVRAAEAGAASRKEAALRLMAAATTFYEQTLWDEAAGAVARAYLETRGIGPDTARAFRLGYAPAPSEAGWSPLASHLVAAGFDLSLAESVGLVVHKREGRGSYDRFRGRLIFPVVLPGGEIVAFSGRILPVHDAPDGEHPPPKYINSPESFLYRKGAHLFGLAQARTALRGRGRAVLVEGNIDVVRLHEVGIREAVAPLGTALTEDQARRLARLVERVVVCFDGDAAGRTATLRAVKTLLAADLDVRVALLPEGRDPAETDPALLERRLDEAPAGLAWWMESLAEAAGTSPDARARALDEVVPVLCRLPRASARTLYAERASAIFGVSLGELRRLARRHRPRPPSASSARVSPSQPVRPRRSAFSDAQIALVRLLVDAPHLANRADALGVRALVDDSTVLGIVEGIVAAAREGRSVDVFALLEGLPEDARAAFERALFDAHAPAPDDPDEALHDVLAACEEERLARRIAALDVAERRARVAQSPEDLREILRQRIDLVRRYNQVRMQRAAGTWQPPIDHLPPPPPSAP